MILGVNDELFRADRFARPPDPELVAVQLREACAWFAWHRRGDADADIDDDRALAAIIDTYVHALVP